jgi:hypothetical protein
VPPQAIGTVITKLAAMRTEQHATPRYTTACMPCTQTFQKQQHTVHTESVRRSFQPRKMV